VSILKTMYEAAAFIVSIRMSCDLQRRKPHPPSPRLVSDLAVCDWSDFGVKSWRGSEPSED
jgi:hypothetical protein